MFLIRVPKGLSMMTFSFKPSMRLSKAATSDSDPGRFCNAVLAFSIVAIVT